MFIKSLNSNKGFSLIEVIIAVVIITLASISIVQLHNFMSTQSVRVGDKSYATQKAMQMMEELRSRVYGAENTQIGEILDAYDDGTYYQSLLTTVSSTTAPSSPISGNKASRYGWKYFRRIEVRSVSDDQYARRVFVRVYGNKGDFTKVSDNPEKYSVSGTPTTLAEISAILRTIKGDYVPTQVYDIYLVAIENVPGWWTTLYLLRPMIANIIEDIQARNPGVIFKTHWITQMSYGRDTQYKPYINDATSSASTAMPYVYIYPGNTGSNNYYYSANVMNANFNVDGIYQTQETNPYPLCDMYNHAIRYPEEENIYNALVAQAKANGTTKPEMTWRMLIEKMNSDPASLKNAIIMNLHGELVPLPAMRNYSDAAKDPVLNPNKRVVTHPENLQYVAGSAVTLRVYPYATDPNNITAPATYQPGFEVVYYDSLIASFPTGTGACGNDVVPTINFDWGSGNPSGVGLSSHKTWTAVWTSSITPRYSEIYSFYATTNDGARLYIDGALTNISNWNDQDPAKIQTSTMTYAFVAGHKYALRLEYYQNSNNASAKLEWRSASQAKEVIPASCSNTSVVVTPATFGPWRSTSTVDMVSIYLKNDYINAGNVTVKRLNGGPASTYAWQTLVQGSTNYTLTHPYSTDTLIRIYGVPLINRANAAGQGLDPSDQLYGMEYIPCPIGTADFTPDLTSNASSPKNTARATITFAAGALSSDCHGIETRIGDKYFTATPAGVDNPPCNVSRTYVWVGKAPPTTELYQLMGDPRHCPYLDVKNNGGYNWYFQTVTDPGYTGFGNANAGWLDTSSGWGRISIPIDLPRYFMLIRQGLLKTQSIWSTMNGVSFFYFGQGGEIGNDKAPWDDKTASGGHRSGIPVLGDPWNLTGLQYINEMVRAADVNATIEEGMCVSSKDNKWYAKYWLGELYPDNQYTNWANSGNLKCDIAGFYRRPYSAITDFGYTRGNCISYTGSSSFLNGGTANAFCHESDTDVEDDNITTLCTNMGTGLNLQMLSQVDVARPFSFTDSTTYPEESALVPYSNIRTSLSIPTIGSPAVSRVFYTTSHSVNAITGPFYGDATVNVTQGANTCYMVYSGVAVQGVFGTAEIGQLVIATMLRTFLDCGLYTATQTRIAQVPLLQITQPAAANDYVAPSTISMAWKYAWTRWDGNKYTEEYGAAYVDKFDLTNETPLVYVLKYSKDRGITWYYCVDDTIAQFGEPPPRSESTHFQTTKTYTWTVSNISKFPAGTYILLVECYRDFGGATFPLHQTYDKVGVYIRR
jgi:prepilin-type N-terminal cleavage/methylation domain-containing protein